MKSEARNIRKKQLLKDRQALLDEIAALQQENLRLRSGAPQPSVVPDSPEEEAAARPHEFSRFPLLRAVDQSNENVMPERTAAAPPDAPKTLFRVAEHLRRYAAVHFGIYAGRPLYAAFLGAMAASDFLLLRSEDEQHGPLALCRAAAAAWGQDIAITPAHPEWTRPADLLGEADPATKQYRETEFLRTIYEAGYSEGVRIAALDNITAMPVNCLAPLLPVLRLSHRQPNISRSISLADSLWPNDPLLLQNGALLWPGNLWLAGTLPPGAHVPQQLRSAAMEFCLPSQQNTKRFLTPLEQPFPMPAQQLRSLFAHAREVYALPEEMQRLYGLVEQYLAEHMEFSLGIQTQLHRFGSVCLACGMRTVDVLDHFFYQKGLRRLEELDPSVLKYELPGLRRFLAETFGKRALPQTMQLLGAMALEGANKKT